MIWLLVMGVVATAATLFYVYNQGKKNAEGEKHEADAKIIKRQRDNDIKSIAAARKLFASLRKRK